MKQAAHLLEEAFFLAQDAVLIERLRSLRKMSETKEALSAASGIRNDAVLERLMKLDVKPEIVAALAAVPLIEVAWADGDVDAAERDAVLAHADRYGISPGSIERELLERWMNHRPEPRLLNAWRTYVKGLCQELDEEARQLLKQELLHATQTTAEASGGFLTVGSISNEEREMLGLLSASFIV